MAALLYALTMYFIVSPQVSCAFREAMRSTTDTLKAIFISVGHRLTASLDTAIVIVKMTCRHPVPEPIRQLIDIRPRD
ncbi:hypothetical protein AB3S75_018599 [Citrus x aurantiifolia]